MASLHILSLEGPPSHLYYITLVISIGIIEQITQYALYESLNKTGETIKSALIFGLIVSCIKRTLSRFLVMIACVG